MTPPTTPQPATRRTRVTAATLLGGAALALVALAAPAAAAPPVMVTLCHATESDVVNPYVSITIAAPAVVSAHIDHQHTEDIIPEFVHDNVTYSQNLDAEGLALLANGCMAPATSTSTTDPPSTTDSSSTTDDNSTEVPFFTSPPALALGLGGSLVATLMMLRRRL